MKTKQITDELNTLVNYLMRVTNDLYTTARHVDKESVYVHIKYLSKKNMITNEIKKNKKAIKRLQKALKLINESSDIISEAANE